MTEHKSFIFKFGEVEVRENEYTLTRAGETVRVEPTAFRVLLYFLRNPGRLVTKDEIMAAVWHDTAVSDNSLTRSVATLRRLLDDSSREPRYIATVQTLGYRFLCEVSAAEGGIATSFPPEPPVNEDPGVSNSTALPGDSASQVQGNTLPVRSKRPSPTRRPLLAGLVISFLVLIAVVAIWRLARKKTSYEGHAIGYSLMEQRVTSNLPEYPIQGATISPDGKYLVYADPTGLYLRQLSTGETRPWTLPEGFVARPDSWFPDSIHLLVERIEGPSHVPELQKLSLYKLSLLGSAPQRIVDDASAGSVSPDGRKIAYLAGPKIGSELWVIDADGTNARQLARAGDMENGGSYASWMMSPVWSPEGQLIAYIEGRVAVGAAPDEPTGTLMIMNADGSGRRQVWSDSRVRGAVWWSADRRILFAYREDPLSSKENDGVYSIRFDDRTGKGAEAPQPITRAEGSIAGLNATADGKRLVLCRTRAPIEVFIAKFDARAHQFEQPRPLTLDENGNYATAWTADSKAVLFVSNRQERLRLFKQGINETTPEILLEAHSIGLPRLSPDGSEALYLGIGSSLTSIMSKPLAGGPPHILVTEPGIVNYGCPRAPAVQCVFSKVSGEDLIFVAFDLKHGAGRELARIRDDVRGWVISPDGSKLAIVIGLHRIRFLSLENGAAHDVTLSDWPLEGADWSADSQTLFTTSARPNGVPVVLEVDHVGHAHELLQGSVNTDFVAMIPSPDGQYGLLMTIRPVENNVWMVDDF